MIEVAQVILAAYVLLVRSRNPVRVCDPALAVITDDSSGRNRGGVGHAVPLWHICNQIVISDI